MGPPPPKLHVLVVDDDVDARSRIEGLFVRAECNVTVVGTCEKALRLLKIDYDGNINSSNQESIPRVDLILVDYFMVTVLGMTGYMMLKAIQESPMKRTPVVVLSSLPEREAELVNKCFEDGCAAFWYKPLCPEDVLNLKNSILKKEKGVKVIDMVQNICHFLSQRCFEDGCAAFWYKPLCPEDVLNLKNSILKKEKGVKVIDMVQNTPEHGQSSNNHRA